MRTLAIIALAAALAACTGSKQLDGSSSSGGGTQTAASGTSGSGSTGTGSTGGRAGSSTGTSTSGTGGTTGAAVDRGPTSIQIDGDPNGLWWDAASATLYLADNDNNRILSWTDAHGVQVAGTLSPAPANGPGLGQLVFTADGTVVVTRFGYGTAGDVAFLKADGGAGTVPGLDLTRRRIGLTVAADGTLYDSYFTKTGGVTVGGVARLDLSGSEVEVISGLVKPVGVLAVGGDLLVSDQAQGEVLRAPQSDPSQVAVFAQNLTPDLLSAGPGGSFFTGSDVGVVYQLDASGASSTFVTGLQQPHGTAYDAVNRRLFVADHDPNHVHNFLRIEPVN